MEVDNTVEEETTNEEENQGSESEDSVSTNRRRKRKRRRQAEKHFDKDEAKARSKEHPELWTVEKDQMYCKYCSKPVDTRKWNAEEHCGRQKHLKLVKQAEKAAKKRQTNNESKQGEFLLDTILTLTSCNIPLEKLDNPVLKQYLRKWIPTVGGTVPTADKCRSKHLPQFIPMHGGYPS